MSCPIAHHESHGFVFFYDDAMLRQITESVRISHFKENELIITKTE